MSPTPALTGPTAPSPRTTTVLRWSRAAVVAGLAAGLGGFAHVRAGGALPAWPVVATLALSLLLVSAAALGRRAGYGRLLALVAGGQTAVHVVLTTAASGHGGAHHPMAHGAAPDVGAHLAMAGGHLLAAAVVAAWLLAGERALWGLLALLGHRLVLGRLMVAAVAPPRPARAGVGRLDQRPTLRRVLGALRRRGPPRLPAPHPAPS